MALIPLVAERSDEIADLCRKHQVQHLDLFGSAATTTPCTCYTPTKEQHSNA